VLHGVKPEEIARAPFGVAPVGSGPFRFLRRAATSEWVFEANPSFPPALGGPPRLAQLIYHTIPEQTAVITGLLTGSVDFGVSVKPSNIKTLEDAKDVHVIQHPTPNWIFVALNTRKRFFDSRDERRAISMAVDRLAIVDGILGGRNVLGRGTVTPVHFAFDSADASLVPRFDPDSARLLLARAGWRDRDGDGILDDASGRPFRFKLKAWQSSGAYVDIVQAMQAQLAKVGIAVEADVVELNTFSQQMQGVVQPDGSRKRDFDAALGNWTDNMRKDDSQLFHSRWRKGARHWTGFDAPRLDAVMDSLAVTMDAAAARRLWTEYQRIIVEDAPLLVLYYSIGLAGVRDHLQGVTTDARGPLANVQHWYITR
jgi:peptide/nickel transport system substrate-binding protein